MSPYLQNKVDVISEVEIFCDYAKWDCRRELWIIPQAKIQILQAKNINMMIRVN